MKKWNKDAPKELDNEHLIFLDDLRDAGKVNMFGAAPHIEREFGLEYNVAREIVKHWMDTFASRRPLG